MIYNSSGRIIILSVRNTNSSGRIDILPGWYSNSSGRIIILSGRYTNSSGRISISSGRYIWIRKLSYYFLHEHYLNSFGLLRVKTIMAPCDNPHNSYFFSKYVLNFKKKQIQWNWPMKNCNISTILRTPNWRVIGTKLWVRYWYVLNVCGTFDV